MGWMHDVRGRGGAHQQAESFGSGSSSVRFLISAPQAVDDLADTIDGMRRSLRRVTGRCATRDQRHNRDRRPPCSPVSGHDPSPPARTRDALQPRTRRHFGTA